MKHILSIAIPNGMENGVFQLVKVALSSMVALFGTYQIAANGVAQSIWSLAALAGVAMGPVFITVIGQCMGNGDTKAADAYFQKLTKITVFVSSLWNLLIFILTPLFMRLYDLQLETKRLVVCLVLAFRDCPADGCDWYYHCNGLRLDHSGGYFLLAAEVREVESISGDIGAFQV